MEGIRENAAKIGNHIVELIKKAIAYIGKLLLNCFTKTSKLQVYALTLAQHAKKRINNALPSGAKVAGQKVLAIDGEMIGGDDLVRAIDEHLRTGMLTEDRSVKLDEAIKVIGNGTYDSPESYEAFTEWLKTVNVGKHRTTQKTDEGATVQFGAPLVFGGQELVVEISNINNPVVRPFIGADDEHEIRGDQVDALTPKQVLDVAEKLSKHLKEVATLSKKNGEKVASQAEKFIANLQKNGGTKDAMMVRLSKAGSL
jgi:hypothetical protein